jgi:hypothetical protein
MEIFNGRCFSRYDQGDQINEEKMGRACGIREREGRENIFKVLLRNLKEKAHL